jgi:hypothetical protein
MDAHRCDLDLGDIGGRQRDRRDALPAGLIDPDRI